MAEKAAQSVPTQQVAKGFAAAQIAARDALYSTDLGAPSRLYQAAATGYRAAIADRDRSEAAAMMGLALALRAPFSSTNDGQEALALARHAQSLKGTGLAQSASLATQVILQGSENARGRLDRLSKGAIHDEVSSLVLAMARVHCSRIDDETGMLLESVPPSQRARLLKAKRLVQVRAFSDAKGELQSLEGGEATLLRARVLAETKEEQSAQAFDEALALFKGSARHRVLFFKGIHSTSTEQLNEIVAELVKAKSPLAALVAAHQHTLAGRYRDADKLLSNLSSLNKGAQNFIEYEEWFHKIKARAQVALGDKSLFETTKILRDKFGNVGLAAHAEAAFYLAQNDEKKGRVLLEEAFLVEPIDEELGKEFGHSIPKVLANAQGAESLRAARRAVAANALLLARSFFDEKARGACRVCAKIDAFSDKANIDKSVALANQGGLPLAQSDVVDIVAILRKAKSSKARRALSSMQGTLTK